MSVPFGADSQAVFSQTSIYAIVETAYEVDGVKHTPTFADIGSFWTELSPGTHQISNIVPGEGGGYNLEDPGEGYHRALFPAQDEPQFTLKFQDAEVYYCYEAVINNVYSNKCELADKKTQRSFSFNVPELGSEVFGIPGSTLNGLRVVYNYIDAPSPDIKGPFGLWSFPILNWIRNNLLD